MPIRSTEVDVLRPIKLPILGDIPFFGPILFDNNIFVYAMFILVAVMTFGLFRTRWGLRSRSVGEHPKAADTLGINVFRDRYRNVIYGGFIAGFGGAYFTVGSSRLVRREHDRRERVHRPRCHDRRALAPGRAFGAALVFGFADALQSKLAILTTPVPGEFLLMAPYIVTIIVVAGVVGKVRPPAADGQPYVKE